MSTFAIGDKRMTIGDVARASAPRMRLRLSEQARRRMVAARAVVERYAEGDQPVYGLNTGLGGNVGYRLKATEIQAFQVQMIRGRCIGVGEPFPEPVARRIFLCRLIGLSQGGSGLSPHVLDLMIAMYNAQITPCIPGRGSIGAGDLGLCAHIGAAVIGRGEVWRQGIRQPSMQALSPLGLAPAVLGPKDGLAIISSSAVSCGYATHVLDELTNLLRISAVTAALSDEGYFANPHIFDPRLADARPARGQQNAAAMFRGLLAGSYLYDPHTARSIQDALSFRVLAPIYGCVIEALRVAVESVETEINSAADSPLVLAPDEIILSSANFHTPAIALSFDTLAIALVHLAVCSVQRVIKMMNASLTGLPKYLSPVGGASNGFNSLQKTAASLHSEIRLKASPASLDNIPVSETIEDHAPQTPLAIRKLEEQIPLMRMLIAIEALVAVQAVDLRKGARLAPATRQLYNLIRSKVPMLEEDRETGPDVDTICETLAFEDTASVMKAVFAAVKTPEILAR